MYWGNALFGTAPIAAAAWLLMLPFAAGGLLLEELRETIVRHRDAQACRPSRADGVRR
jgi:hypothetical protein